MTAVEALRLALIPLAVWAASLAARRWGHSAAGYLGGLPMIGGPITLFIALDLGSAFAARSALYTLAAIAGQAAHLLAFAHVARRRSWAWALAAGWGAFATVSLGVTWLPLSTPVALALAVASLAAAWRWLPDVSGAMAPPAIPPMELRLRIVAAFGLAAAILWGAPRLGPVASGLLLSVPITGSILPPFTLALHGPDAVARLARGFVVGLSGFTFFFAVVAATLEAWGAGASFLLAVAAALAAIYAAGRLVRALR